MSLETEMNKANSEPTFVALSENNEAMLCKILFTLRANETSQRTIFVFTDGSIDREGATSVYASACNVDQEELLESDDEKVALKMSPLTEGEWSIVEQTLEKWQQGELDGSI